MSHRFKPQVVEVLVVPETYSAALEVRELVFQLHECLRRTAVGDVN